MAFWAGSGNSISLYCPGIRHARSKNKGGELTTFPKSSYPRWPMNRELSRAWQTRPYSTGYPWKASVQGLHTLIDSPSTGLLTHLRMS